MNLALVILLGFCALMAHAQASQEYDSWENLDSELFEDKPGFVLGLVNGMVEKIKGYVKKYTTILNNQLNNLVNKFVSEALRLSDSALENVKDMIRDAKAELISKKDNNAVVCFDKYRPILDEIYTKSKKDVENCVVHAVGEIYRVKSNVQKYIDAVKEQVSNIGEILKQCIRPLNPFYTMKCMLKNVNNVLESLKEIVANAFKALKEANKELRKIISEAQFCVRKIVNEAEVRVKSVFGEVRDCLENGLSTESPTTSEEQSTTEAPTTTEATTSTMTETSTSTTTETSTTTDSVVWPETQTESPEQPI